MSNSSFYNKYASQSLSSNRTKRRRKSRAIVRVLLLLIGCVLLVLILAIAFRNPIIEKIAEKTLTEQLGTPVHISKFKLSILKPGISIRSFSMDDKKDSAKYAVKTGLIKVSFDIMPYFRKNLVSVPEVILDHIEFGIPKDPNVPVQPSTFNKDFRQVFSTIDTNTLIQDYVSNIETLNQIDKMKDEFDVLQKKGNEIILQSEKIVEVLENDFSAIGKDLNTTDIVALQKRIQTMQGYVEQTQKASNRIEALQKDVNNFGKKAKKISASLKETIHKDSEFILSTVVDPKNLAFSVVIDMVEQMLTAKVESFQVALTYALEILVALRGDTKTASIITPYLLDTYQVFSHDESNYNASDIDNYITSNDEISALEIANTINSLEDTDPMVITVANTDLKEQSEQDALGFLIGKFRLSVGKEPLFYFNAENITNRLYTSTTPTTFSVIGGTHNFTIEGEGAISLHPQALTMLDVSLSHTGIPVFIDNLEIIELSSIEGKARGDIQVSLSAADSGVYTSTLQLYNANTSPIEGSTTGFLVAETIDDNSPVDFQVRTSISGGSISDIKVQSTFFDIISTAVAAIIQDQVEGLSQDLLVQIDQEIFQQATERLDTITNSTADTNSQISEQVASVQTLNSDIKKELSSASNYLVTLQKEIITEQVEESVEQVKETVKSAVDSVKSLF